MWCPSSTRVETCPGSLGRTAGFRCVYCGYGLIQGWGLVLPWHTRLVYAPPVSYTVQIVQAPAAGPPPKLNKKRRATDW